MPKSKQVSTGRVATHRRGEKRKRGLVRAKKNHEEFHSEIRAISEVVYAEPSIQQKGPTSINKKTQVGQGGGDREDKDGTSRCPDPFSTMESVKSCPQSKKSLMKAANRKACQQIYVNCIGLPKQDMEYHCLYNPIINGYVEVCAPSRRIDSGLCPVYNHLQKGIQLISYVSCKDEYPFMSTDAYKVPKCCREVKRINRSATKTDSTNSTESCLGTIKQFSYADTIGVLTCKNNHSSGYLPLSLTMIYVDGCPDSKESWDKAAEMKGCHEISYKCVGLFNDLGLEYHCLINPYNNATVEVCAPPQRIFGGYCAEFSICADSIQSNFDVVCKAFKQACPEPYMSTEAYRYQECYEGVRRRTLPITTNPWERDRMPSALNPENNTQSRVLAISLGIGLTFGFFLVILIIWKIVSYFRREEYTQSTHASQSITY